MAEAILARLDKLKPWLEFMSWYSSNSFHADQIFHTKEAIEGFIKSEDYEYVAVLVTVLEQMVEKFDRFEADAAIDRWHEQQQPRLHRQLAILRGEDPGPAWEIQI